MIIERAKSTDDPAAWPLTQPARISLSLAMLSIGYVSLFFCLGYLWAVLT